MVDMMEKQIDAAGNVSGNLVAGAEKQADKPDFVDPPDLPTTLATMADLIEHLGLHHNAKFGSFCENVRAFQRSLAAEKPAS